MNRLARVYAYGRGRTADAQAAASWHLAARASGISDLELDALLSGLTQEEMEKARTFARTYSLPVDKLAVDEAATTP
jgi:hypothetical protein